MVTIFTNCLLLAGIYAASWFIVSLVFRRNDVADIAWGMGYVLICVYLYLTRDIHPVLVLLYVLIFIWGYRLSVHIFSRNRKKTEDFRYKAWREAWGKSFYIRSFLQVYLLQGLLMILIVAPVIHAAASPRFSWNAFTWAGLLTWISGFYFQVVADYQLTVFTRNKTKDNKILKTGLWKYSRHPNYFGEIMMWWGIFIITLPVENSWFFIFSPVLITFLLVFVSGVPMLEKKYAELKEYEIYKKQTSMLIPMPQRKLKDTD